MSIVQFYWFGSLVRPFSVQWIEFMRLVMCNFLGKKKHIGIFAVSATGTIDPIVLYSNRIDKKVESDIITI